MGVTSNRTEFGAQPGEITWADNATTLNNTPGMTVGGRAVAGLSSADLDGDGCTAGGVTVSVGKTGFAAEKLQAN